MYTIPSAKHIEDPYEPLATPVELNKVYEFLHGKHAARYDLNTLDSTLLKHYFATSILIGHGFVEPSTLGWLAEEIPNEKLLAYLLACYARRGYDLAKYSDEVIVTISKMYVSLVRNLFFFSCGDISAPQLINSIQPSIEYLDAFMVENSCTSSRSSNTFLKHYHTKLIKMIQLLTAPPEHAGIFLAAVVHLSTKILNDLKSLNRSGESRLHIFLNLMQIPSDVAHDRVALLNCLNDKNITEERIFNEVGR